MPFSPFRPLLLLALALLPTAARAGEAHYVIVFGSQQIPNRPNYAHTFATFVRATWPGDGPPCNVMLEAHTISWLPANGIVRTHSLLPECGRNYGLFETLKYVRDNGERISMWGPYPVDARIYYRALRSIAELDSGTRRFKPVDSGWPARRVCNCIHAVSEVPGNPLLIVASPGFGEVASYACLLKMRPWLQDENPQYWVSSAIGLDAVPIIYRDRITPPASGTFLGPIYRVLGGERNLVATYGPPR
jgi:hypothetical protein